MDSFNWDDVIANTPLDVHTASINYAKAECASHGAEYIEPTYVHVPLPSEFNLNDQGMVKEVARSIAGFRMSDCRMNFPFKEVELNSDVMTIPIFANALEGLSWRCEVKQLHESQIPPMTISQIVLDYLKTRLTTLYPDLGDEDYDDLSFFEIRMAYPVTDVEPSVQGDTVHVPSLMFGLNYEDTEDRIVITIYDPILYSLITAFGQGLYHFNLVDGSLVIFGEDLMKTSSLVEFSTIKNVFASVANILYISTLMKSADDLGIAPCPATHFSVGTFSSMDVPTHDPIVNVFDNERFINVFNCWSGVYQFSLTANFCADKYVFGFQPNTFLHGFSLTYLPTLFHQFTESMLRSAPASFSGEVVVFPSLSTDNYPSDATAKLIEERNAVSAQIDALPNSKAYSSIKKNLIQHLPGGAKVKLQQILRAYCITLTGRSVRSYGDAPGTWMDYICSNFKIPKYESISDIVNNDSGYTPIQYAPYVLKKLKTLWSEFATIHCADLRAYQPTTKVDVLLSDAAFEMGFDFASQSTAHNDLFTAVLNKVHRELADEGIFIMKMYDMTSPLRDLILNLSQHFKLAEFYKPANSWRDNAERYLICIGYSPKPISPIFYNLLVQDASLIASQTGAVASILEKGFKVHTKKKLGSVVSSLHVTGDIPPAITLMLGRLRFSSVVFMDLHSGSVHSYTNSLGDKFLKIQWHHPSHPFPNSFVVQETVIGYAAGERILSEPMIFHTGYIPSFKGRYDFMYLEPQVASIFTKDYTPMFLSNVSSDHCPKECGLHEISFFLSRWANIILPSHRETFSDFLSFKNYMEYVSLTNFANFVAAGFRDFNFTVRQFFRAFSIRRPSQFNLMEGAFEIGYGSTRSGLPLCISSSFSRAKKRVDTTDHFTEFLENEDCFAVSVRYSVLTQEGWTSLSPKYIEYESGAEMAFKSAGPIIREISDRLSKRRWPLHFSGFGSPWG